MIQVRPAAERGFADHGWLQTHHTFSFAHYYDPQYMGFRNLRVLNDDTVQPGEGFGTHGHRDMEIISYVVEGALEHRDSMGTGSVLRAGDVQRMTAGRGVTHSEFNHSKVDPLRFLQIWVLPEREGLEPEYEERNFSDKEKSGRLRLIVSPGGDEASLRIHHDTRVFASILEQGETVEHVLEPGRHAWIQVVEGELDLDGNALGRGDGASVSGEKVLRIEGRDRVEFLLFDLA